MEPQINMGLLLQDLKQTLPKVRSLTLGSYTAPQLKSWVHALKQGGSSTDYKRIAVEWIRRRQLTSNVFTPTPIIIIPSPARIIGTRDHAFCLAEALSHETGWVLLNLLEFQNLDEKTQKSKGIHLRAQRTFKIRQRSEIISSNYGEHPDNIKDLHYGTIIFIDDVVTTGSTAMAAWKALKKPPRFEVWCMAIQPRYRQG